MVWGGGGFYFAQPLEELNVEQLALLVAIVRGASYYNPRRHPQRALKRRNLVLNIMAEQEYLNVKETKVTVSAPIEISKKSRWSRAKYPEFIDLVKRQLLRDYKMGDLQNVKTPNFYNSRARRPG